MRQPLDLSARLPVFNSHHNLTMLAYQESPLIPRGGYHGKKVGFLPEVTKQAPKKVKPLGDSALAKVSREDRMKQYANTAEQRLEDRYKRVVYSTNTFTRRHVEKVLEVTSATAKDLITKFKNKGWITETGEKMNAFPVYRRVK